MCLNLQGCLLYSHFAVILQKNHSHESTIKVIYFGNVPFGSPCIVLHSEIFHFFMKKFTDADFMLYSLKVYIIHKTVNC